MISASLGTQPGNVSTPQTHICEPVAKFALLLKEFSGLKPGVCSGMMEIHMFMDSSTTIIPSDGVAMKMPSEP